MLIKCQACGNETSDLAKSCPKCSSPRDTFLGAPEPCYECGNLTEPAYSECRSCGAPTIANADWTLGLRSDEPAADDATSPLHPQAKPLSFDSGASAAEDDGSPAAGSVFVKLPPLADFAVRLRYGLLAFAVVMAAHALLAGGVLWVLNAYSNELLTDDQFNQIADTVVRAEPLLNAAAVVCLFLCAYYYCRFLFRALKNLRPISNGNSTWNPTWGVVMHFVPICNFFGVMPMADAWNGSHYVSKRSAAANGLLAAWWTFWIVSVVLSNASGALFVRPDMYGAGLITSMLGSLSSIVAASLLRAVSARIANAHDSARIEVARVSQ